MAVVKTVLVTGASGFIASHVVQQLLEAGYRVRGTVRSSTHDSSAHLKSLAGASERLELVAAELLDPDVWPQVVNDCDYIMHMASPYALDVKDPQRDLVDPALNGTRNVLRASAKVPSVKRVVLTSSMAAVTDEPDQERVLTEQEWNTESSLSRNPYYYSKTVAEQEAWRLATAHHFSLVVINPFMVIGPSLSPALNTSNALFADLLKGTYPGLMRLVWGLVDVRDVARAHLEAMERTGANGRYLCAAGTIGMREVVELLNNWGYERFPLPKLGLDCPVGDFAVRLSSYFQPRGVGTYLRTHLGRTPRFDTSKIQRELGIHFRPLPDTIREAVADLVRAGHVPIPARAATIS
jgi:dihydroflavonol-4-reductase